MRLIVAGPSKVWPKSKNPASEAVRREREEEWRKLKSHYNIAKPVTVVMTVQSGRHPKENPGDASEYFDDIQDVKITKDMLDLAKHIVEQKSGHFEPERLRIIMRPRWPNCSRKSRRGSPSPRRKRQPRLAGSPGYHAPLRWPLKPGVKS
jgi:hypothetical protein